MFPAPSVATSNWHTFELTLVLVCTPSVKEKSESAATTSVRGRNGGSGFAKTTEPVTFSLVAYGAVTEVNGCPVKTYVVGLPGGRLELHEPGPGEAPKTGCG